MPCLDCGAPSSGRTRCTRCHTRRQQSRDRRRGSVTQRFGSGWTRISRRIIERDHGLCWICGQPGADTTDHIIPRANGGTNDEHNLAAAHKRCNSSRGAN